MNKFQKHKDCTWNRRYEFSYYEYKKNAKSTF
jgi:hypothetical protein